MYRLFIPVVGNGSIPRKGLAMARPHADDAARLAISWRYNWGPVDDCQTAAGGFVPMLWSGSPSSKIPASYGGPLLVLNEPDNPNQLNITPQEAARRLAVVRQAYPQARIIAPGVLSYNLAWLENFIKLVQLPDVWAYHAYVEGPYNSSAIIAQLDRMHQISGGVAWITEYGVLSGDLSEFVRLTEWMQAQPWIERYAAYTNRQDLSAAWAIARGVELVGDDGSLTEIGKWYAALGR